MAVGEGKYDQISEQILLATKAHTVIVAIIGGVKGNGFSVTSADPEAQLKLPAMLRAMADDIERSTS